MPIELVQKLDQQLLANRRRQRVQRLVDLGHALGQRGAVDTDGRQQSAELLGRQRRQVDAGEHLADSGAGCRALACDLGAGP